MWDLGFVGMCHHVGCHINVPWINTRAVLWFSEILHQTMTPPCWNSRDTAVAHIMSMIDTSRTITLSWQETRFIMRSTHRSDVQMCKTRYGHLAPRTTSARWQKHFWELMQWSPGISAAVLISFSLLFRKWHRHRRRSCLGGIVTGGLLILDGRQWFA